MEGHHIIIIIAIVAVLVILLLFMFNKNTQTPVTTSSTFSHNVTGLDGLIYSVQPGVFAGLTGATSTPGIIGKIFGNKTAANTTGVSDNSQQT